MPHTITGRYLNKLWGVGVRHALYNKDGSWYHQLTKFPGALFDSEGYVVFPTQEDFLECPYLRIRKDVGCRAGIRTIPGYIRVGGSIAVDITEPKRSQRINQTVSRIIRNTARSSAIKLLYEDTCQICGTCLNLGNRTYSEAHHIRPLGSPHNGPDEIDNLICVCPTCHVLVDYAAIPLDPEKFHIALHRTNIDYINYHNQIHNERFEDTSS